MFSVEGNLNTATLQAILEVLNQKNPAATLLISDGMHEKVIYFSTGGIRLYSSDGRRVCRLEEFLEQRGLASKEQIEQARLIAVESRRETLDEVLERKGILPRNRFLEVITELIFRELCDLVTWEKAIYEFYEGNPPPQIFDQDHPALFAALNVKALAARVQEWNKEWCSLRNRLHSERICPKLLDTGVLQKKEIAAAAQKLYVLLDGERNLRDLARSSALSFAEVARVVHEGVKDGDLRGNLTAEKEASTPSEVLEDIERLEEALDKAINAILIHRRIAISYEKLGDPTSASEHHESIGDLHAESGRVQKALESYRKAMTLSPQNITAHQSLIKRLQDMGQEEKAREEIEELAKKLLSFGLADEALGVLRAIKAKAAKIYRVRLLYAHILGVLGKINEAVAEYLAIARDKLLVGSLDGIEDIYRKVLALDPTNRVARAGLSRERRRQVGGTYIWLNRLSGAAALVILAFWGANEAMARAGWRRAEASVRQSLRQGGNLEGLEKVWEIPAKFPATLLSASALEAEEKLFRECFYRLEEDLQRAAGLKKEGRFNEAREVFQSVLTCKLGPSQVERARLGIRELDSQEREAKELRRNARALMDSRFYEDAFAVCRKILDHYPADRAGLEVPFHIHSDPPNVDVKINGSRWGTTPGWITVPMDNLPEIRLEKPGFTPVNLKDLENRRSPFIEAVLKKSS